MCTVKDMNTSKPSSPSGIDWAKFRKGQLTECLSCRGRGYVLLASIGKQPCLTCGGSGKLSPKNVEG